MSYSDLDIKSGDQSFVKLESGKIKTIHIIDKKPKSEIVHWVGKEKKTCLGQKSKCEYCLNNNPAKQRFSCKVYDRDLKKVKVFEFGAMIAKQIKGHAEMLEQDGQTVHDVDFKIKTEGAGIETEYLVAVKTNIEPLPDDLDLGTDEEIPF